MSTDKNAKNPRASMLYQFEVAWEVQDKAAGRHLSFKDVMQRLTGFKRVPTDAELKKALAPYKETE